MSDYEPYLIPLELSSPSKFKQFLPTADKVLLFDIDCTLYSSKLGFDKFIENKINQYLINLGLGDSKVDMCAKYTEEYGLALKGILVNHPEADPKDFFKQVEGELDIKDYIQRDEELITMLDKLSDYKMYCFTNAYYPHALNVLNAMGLTKYFIGVFYVNYTSCGTFLCKPDIHAYKLVEKMLKANKIYFYDDNMANVNTGREVGWECELIDKDYDIKTALNKFIEIEGKQEVKKVLMSDMISARYVDDQKCDTKKTAEVNENKP